MRVSRRDVMRGMALGAGALVCGVSGSEADGQMDAGANKAEVTPKPVTQGDAMFWLETSLKRVFPNSSPGGADPLNLPCARNERISFQACVRNLRTGSIAIRAAVDAGGLQTRIRRVGCVPMPHLNTDVPKEEIDGIGHVGMFPDPLYAEDAAHVGPEENAAFWINVSVPADAKPGPRKIKVSLTVENEFRFPGWQNPKPVTVELEVRLDVRPVTIKPRKDFPVTQWINIESIWDYYKIEPFSERFWELADAYIANMVEHGIDCIYSPVFSTRHEIMPRPGQLLRVRRTAPDKYEFDFTDVRRWISLALKHGANYVEWSHFFTPAPTSAKYPQRIFERWEKTGDMLWPPETLACSDTYRKFLEQFLPKFKQVLTEEKVLDRSFFHCADEPDGPEQTADYKKSRAMLKELAPWMKVLDAMSDTAFATEGLCDMPIPSIATAHIFDEAKCPHWVYFCCGPRGEWLQRLLDTPLPKIRMSGWLFHKLRAKGFLHWGHNYWYRFCTGDIADPFQDTAVGAWPGLPYGDPFVVYPGADGPIDSIRYEVLWESLQDYALLQSAGIRPEDKLLEKLVSYAIFPKSEDWLKQARKAVLEKGQP